MITRLKFFAALGLLFFGVTNLCLAAPQAAKLTFRRVFPASTPELIEITVIEDSDTATYEIRQLDEEAGSTPFVVGAPLRAKMFGYAAELHHFQGLDLDVHRKIANLGEKTFRWEQGTQKYETKFNYTLDKSATQLLQIFEGLARQQEHFVLISRRMKYDRLGINDALLQFESDLNRGLMPEPSRLVPLLDQISGDSKFVDIARQRARTLADRIRHSAQIHQIDSDLYKIMYLFMNICSLIYKYLLPNP